MKGKVSRLLAGVDHVIDWTGKVLCFGWIIICFFLLYEVVSRYVFNAPTIWSGELCLYIFGGVGVMAGGYCLLKDDHIKVDLFYAMYPKRVKAIVDCVIVAFIVFWALLLVIYGWEWFIRTVVNNEMSITQWRVVLWPVRLTIPIAGVLLIIAALCKFIRAIYIAVTGEEL